MSVTGLGSRSVGPARCWGSTATQRRIPRRRDDPGHRMHFADEGAGEPVVFVYGNPAWSFQFRHLITELRSGLSCAAPDQIGFGLSAR